MTRRILPLLLAIVSLTLASCRVDVAVELDVAQNGSGTLTVRALADPDVVGAAPGLAEDIRVDDLRAAGWAVDGPLLQPDGSLLLTLTRAFSTPEQATALLSSVNGPDGPLRTIALGRTATDTEITYTLTGALGTDGGVLAFTDPDLLAALGVSPYADEIAAAGIDPSEAVGITFTAALPGDVRSTTGGRSTAALLGPSPTSAPDGTTTDGATTDSTEFGGDTTGFREVLTWVVPVDGSRLDVATVSEESLRRGALWSTLAGLALVALVVWTVGSVVLIGWVVHARRRRGGPRRRPGHRATPRA